MSKGTNLSGPQSSPEGRFYAVRESLSNPPSLKKSALRGWHSRLLCDQECNRSERGHGKPREQDQIHDFLASTAPPDDERQPRPRPAKARRPQIKMNHSELAQRKSHYPDVVKPSGPGSMSFAHLPAISEDAEMFGALVSSTVASLPLSTSDDQGPLLRGVGPRMLKKCVSSPALSRLPATQIDTPDDFDRFKSNLQGLVELESFPATSSPSGVTQGGAASVPPNRGGTYQAYSAYPGAPIRKPVPASYVPPVLQSGFADGVPPALRVTHPATDTSSTTATRSAARTSETRAPTYSWPLVDFNEEMFLNAEPNIEKPRRNMPKHQEPRIPSLQFSGQGLAEELRVALGRLRTPREREEEQEGKIVVPPPAPAQARDRAWMSPTMPLDLNAYQMEAAMPMTTPTTPTIRYPSSAAELASSNPPTPPSRQGRAAKAVSVPSPVSPVSPLGAGERVSFHEYNWPRFSDVQKYEDPADEYSRRYRDRRREVRREIARDRSQKGGEETGAG